MAHLKSVYFFKNNDEYLYQVNGITKKIYFYFGIDALFDAVVSWYNVNNRPLVYLNKKSKNVTLPRSSIVCNDKIYIIRSAISSCLLVLLLKSHC